MSNIKLNNTSHQSNVSGIADDQNQTSEKPRVIQDLIDYQAQSGALKALVEGDVQGENVAYGGDNHNDHSDARHTDRCVGKECRNHTDHTDDAHTDRYTAGRDPEHVNHTDATKKPESDPKK